MISLKVCVFSEIKDQTPMKTSSTFMLFPEMYDNSNFPGPC